MAGFLLTEDVLKRAVTQAIETQIREAVTEAVSEAKRKLDTEIPRIVAGVSLELQRHISMRTMHDEILISVKLERGS